MLSLRALVLGLALNIIFTILNSYLGINFGMGFGYGLITLLLVYVLFHKRNGSTKQEAVVAIIASSGYFMTWSLAIAMYIRVNDPGNDLPTWFVPSKDVLISGSMFDPAWLIPIMVHSFITFAAIFLGVIIALAVSDLILQDKKLTFPFARVTSVLIDTFFSADGRARLVTIWIVMGVLLTFVQYLLKGMGFETLLYDFTPQLPYGFSFGILINIGIMAVSYIIDPAMTLTILFLGILYYFAIAPYIVKLGLFPPADNANDYYMNMLFNFSLSPGLGAFILSGPIIMLVKLIKKKISGKETVQDKELGTDNDNSFVRTNLLNFSKTLFRNLAGRKILGISYVSLVIAYLLFIVILNIFYPLSLITSVMLTLAFLVPIAIIDIFILIKMRGEIGMTFGAHRLIMYEGVIYGVGYRKYLGYLSYPISDPWMSSALIYWFKLGELTNTDKKAILITFIIRLIPVYFTSLFFILMVWYTVGIPSEMMPAISIIQMYAIVKTFATAGFGTFLNPFTFLLGGLISGVLGALTPISPIGIALVLFLPPTYIIPFGVGGLLRLYTDRKYGKKWYHEKGQYIASGFTVGALLTQIALSLLIFA